MRVTCYAVTADGESGTMSVGFAPGFVEGPQEGSEGGEGGDPALPSDPEMPLGEL